MRVAAIQTDVVWEDRDANLATIDGWLGAAAHAGARLVVLSEMFPTGFSMNTNAVAEPVDGPSTQFLVQRAAALGVWIGGSLAERINEGERPFNTFVLASPDGVVQRYRKMRPFTPAGERDAFESGDSVVTFEVEGVSVTPFICYDLRFADLFWNVAAETDLYLVVANWPSTRAHHWRSLLTGRAIENQAYVVGVNRVGAGDGLYYCGDTRAISPSGDLLASAGEQETMILVDVDPAVVRQVRRDLPFLADRP